MNKSFIFKVIFGVITAILIVLPIIFRSISQIILGLTEKGITIETVYPLILIPVIAMLIALLRIVIGLNFTSVYAPALLIVTSFYLNFELTVSIFLISVILSFLLKSIINRFHIHQAVKISLISSLISIILLICLDLTPAGLFPLQTGSSILLPVILIALIGEKFYTFKLTKTNAASEISQIIKTVIFSAASFILLGGNFLNWHFTNIKDAILMFPEVIIICTLITFFIGKYTGLRLSEIIRFRKLIFKSK